jgi:hypothetical protein
LRVGLLDGEGGGVNEFNASLELFECEDLRVGVREGDRFCGNGSSMPQNDRYWTSHQSCQVMIPKHENRYISVRKGRSGHGICVKVCRMCSW